jgi:tetratricopeptide (TPR) repeat protein
MRGGALCAAADELLVAGDLDGALDSFDRALQADTRSARAWTGRATVLARRDRFGEALGCIRRALDERSSYAPAVILQAEVLVKAGRRPEALVSCYEPIAADAEVADHWVRRGRVFEELDCADDAAESYSTAGAMESTAVTWCLRAELFARQGRLEEAAHDFARAVAAEPGHVDAWYRLARTYFELKKLSDVKWALERFFALAPPDGAQTAAARTMFAGVTLPPPRPAAAAAELEVPELGEVFRRPSQAPAPPEMPAPEEAPAPEPPPPPAPPREEAFDDELELTGNAAEAVVASSRPFYLDEIDQLHAAGKNIEALRRIAPILVRQPDLMDGWLSQAKILIALDELDVAVTSLERVIRLDRGHVVALTLMATCWQRLKRPDHARETLQRVLEIAKRTGNVSLGDETRAQLAALARV